MNNLDELSALVEIGQYYLGLPAISSTLINAIIANKPFIVSLRSNPSLAVTLAFKLKHKVLFADSVTLSMGPWNSPAYINLKESEG